MNDPPASLADAAESSLLELYREHYGALVRLVALVTRDPAEAEDIVQEAFVRFHRAGPRLRDRSAAPAYLRTTCLNLARSRLRALRAARRRETGLDRAPALLPEDRAVVADTQRSLLQALAELPARQRECLVLRYFNELSDREIGDSLGVSIGSVKRHLHRGLRRLQAHMEAHA